MKRNRTADEAGEDPSNQHIAIYWDFENIHASLCTRIHGPGWYRDFKNRHSVQEPHVDIGSIMEYATGLGIVNINKAYANWGPLRKYSQALQQHSLDLIQIFPPGANAKNGADIRLAIEVVEDLSMNPHIDLVIVVGGDSDYIAVARHVRKRGKHIVGVGAKETTNHHWVDACNEFKFYSSLLVKSSSGGLREQPEYDADDIADAKELLRRALQRHSSQTGQPTIVGAALKPLMTRLNPSFDEGNFGFGSFGEFLEKCADMIDVHKGEFDRLVSLKGTASAGVPAPLLRPYERILKQQQIRLPTPEVLHEGIAATTRIFDNAPALPDFDDYRAKMAGELKAAGLSFADTDISRIKGTLFKAFCFDTTSTDGIGLKPEVRDGRQLHVRVLGNLVERVLENVDIEEIDREQLFELLAFDEATRADVSQMIDAFTSGDAVDVEGG